MLDNIALGKASSASTRLHIENLEHRRLLSTVPPTVSDVTISSSSWEPAFIDYLHSNGLGENGFSIPVGTSEQSQSLPWLDLNQISITFSEDVHVNENDLSISGVTNATYRSDHFIYDPQAKRATWTLETPLAAEEKVHLDLDGNGSDPVTDLDNNILDGEWTNEVSTYESGNGTAGGDFEFSFNVLEGDTYATDNIDYFDYVFTRGAEGLTTTDSSYDPAYDLDGDGTVEVSDWQAVLGHLWTTLPTGTPVGVSDDAPTSTGFELEEITDRVFDTRVSLHDVFDDLEDSDSSLTYTISNQTNSGLFDSVTVDSGAGELVLNPESTGSGRSTFTITATDSSGLFVEATLTADLDYNNSAPLISNYVPTYLGGLVWEVSGTVTDTDDNVEGMIVQLADLFNERVVVAADGSFYYRAIVLGSGDWVNAQTEDQHGELSNNPWTFVGV